jgi:hypothetical protein
VGGVTGRRENERKYRREMIIKKDKQITGINILCIYIYIYTQVKGNGARGLNFGSAENRPILPGSASYIGRKIFQEILM